MKKYLAILAILFAGVGAHADQFCVEQGNCMSYAEGDKWTFNFDDIMNLSLAYGSSMTIALLLEHEVHLSCGQAALYGTVANMLLWTAGEMFIDKYFGRADVQQYYVGSIVAGVVVYVFRF